MGTGVKIFWILVFIAACVSCYFLYEHYSIKRQAEDGAVVCNGCMTPDQKAAFDRENSGDTADGQSEHKTRTASQENAAGNPQGAAAAGLTTPAAAAPATTPAQAQGTSAPMQAPANAPATYPSTPAGLPVADTVSPNPANGMRFTGTGSYQWYRQGNITWRVDTASGGSCIAFATLEEWRKQIVYSHGCGRGA